MTEEEETELLETFHWEENDGRMKHRQVGERLTDVQHLALYVMMPHYWSPAHYCLTFDLLTQPNDILDKEHNSWNL